MQFKITPFILIVTFAAVAVGSFVLYQFIPRTIQLQKLSPARDLRGTWEGTVFFKDTYLSKLVDARECTGQYLVRLVIDTQTNGTISGTDSFLYQKDTLQGKPGFPNGCMGEPKVWNTPKPFSADISGSRLTNINLDWLTIYVGDGSLTTDTITINPGESHTSSQTIQQISEPINLLRKQ